MSINRSMPTGPAVGTARAAVLPRKEVGGPSFGDALRSASQELTLSRHAARRVDRRELGLDEAKLARLNQAINKAAEKGARNSVVVLDDLAVVVDVPGRTVITAMQREAGRERVFTNVDSVVIA
jgi:flagellar operon protein